MNFKSSSASYWQYLKYCVASVFFLMHGYALGAEIMLVGTYPGKALIMVDNGPPRIIAVGQKSPEGVKLLSISGNTARVELNGQVQQLNLNERGPNIGNPPAKADSNNNEQIATLYADSRGHFLSDGTINGATVRFLVDTGASGVAMGRSDAIRAGINYLSGQESWSSTANGPAKAWRVQLNEVRLGAITLRNVEGMIMQQDMPFVLLGMSFLNRMEMRREGPSMVLKRRY